MAQVQYLSASWDAFDRLSYRWKLPVVAVCSYSAYFIYSKISTHISHSRFKREHGCQSPTRLPQSERIIGLGLLLQIRRNTKALRNLEAFTEWFESHGQTWTLTVFGQTVLLTCDPENVKAILATQFEDFGLGQRADLLSPLLGKGIFVAEGAAWQHSRALIRPAFTRTQVADLESFESHVQKLMAKVPKDGSTVDLAPLFFRLTLDIATDFLFGESINSLESEEGSKDNQFEAAFEYSHSQLGSTGSYGWLKPLFYFSKFQRSCRFMHSFVDEFVAKAQREQREEDRNEKSSAKDIDDPRPHGRYLFLRELLKGTNDPIQIRDESMGIMFAGRDTTAGLLISIFYNLSTRPSVWEKLQSEISELNDEPPNYETLKNMKYLKHVINETLRLYPVAPANAREAAKDTTLPRGGGPDGKAPIFVRKGQNVSWSLWSMHRDKTFYGEDAEEFRPERWETLRTSWEFLPFSGGPRICIGQQFALIEASYTVVRLLQTFPKIESRDAKPWHEKFGFTTTNVNGAKVALMRA